MVRPVKIDPFTFRWHVNSAGYEWLRGVLNKDLHLVPRDVPGVGLDIKEPSSALFLEFAALNPSQNDILAFANEHGDLFHPGFGTLSPRENGKAPFGTPLSDWERAIFEMRELVEFWSQIKQRQLKKLKRIVRRSENEIGYSIAGTWVATLDAPMSRFAPGDILLPAKYALQKEINRRLSDPQTACVPQLAWTPDNHQRVIFKASNLLAEMWLQFAQAVTEEYQLKICEGCGKYFQVGPGGRRADSKTCGDTCRARKHRA